MEAHLATYSTSPARHTFMSNKRICIFEMFNDDRIRIVMAVYLSEHIKYLEYFSSVTKRHHV